MTSAKNGLPLASARISWNDRSASRKRSVPIDAASFRFA